MCRGSSPSDAYQEDGEAASEKKQADEVELLNSLPSTLIEVVAWSGYRSVEDGGSY